MNVFPKVILGSSLLLTFIFSTPSAAAQSLTALIITNKGEIILELNQQAAPTSVANFVNLSHRGFYDGLTFHRVENRFMIQGGDPEGDGTGSPGYRFAGETNLRHNRPGVISTANAGPGTDGSQFFITHVATPHLDGIHSVFGVVTSGMQVVNQIRRGDRIQSIVIKGDISDLWTQKAEDLARWNAALDENFQGLRPAPIP
jgi:peptidyl-prolyl cis-trans isomerase B (cyclophilin B)